MPSASSPSDAAVDEAGRLMARVVGLRLDPAIRGRLASAVRAGAHAHHLELSAYVARLADDASLVQGLIDRVTVQESAFFRDPAQFDALRDQVLPGVAGPLRVWSAGCAHGQEAYSVAIALAESGVAEWEVVATDVSVGALERTRRGRYTSRELTGLSAERRAQHVVARGQEWEISPFLRRRVRVVHHNLVADPPPFQPGTCDIVFCRNVLIYLDHAALEAFVRRLAQWITPRGWLFLGYSESLWQTAGSFRLQRVGETFAYRPRTAAEAGAGALPATPPPPPAPPPRPRPQPEQRSRPLSGRVTPPSPLVDRATAPGPRPTTPAPRPPSAVGAAEDIGELLGRGETAMNAGEFESAVRIFRRCAFLDPDRPEASLHLALALEEVGDAKEARRAYAAARAALVRSGTEAVEATLEGYHGEELVRLLDAKLAGLPPRLSP